MATILIVDDYPAGRKLLHSILGPQGHRVLEATDGAEALELARAHRPDLVISDILMPTMDGYEFVRRLRQDPVAAATPVIFISSNYQDGPAGALARAGGVLHLLRKPLTQDEVLRTVETALGGASPPAPPAVPEEFGREHLRLLTDKLAQEVQELYAAKARLEIEIAERRRGEAALEESRRRLQALSRQLIQSQEAERRHLARELHDEIGQSLTALQLQLEMAARKSAGAADPHLGEAQTLIKELLSRVREMSLDLRPTVLDNLGLLAALHWYFARYQARTSIAVQFEYTGGGDRLLPELETAVFRIVQEALTNVARHAGVRALRVGLRVTPERLTVQIADEGTGFDAEAALAAGATSGLSGMRERVTLLGGQLKIEAAPGKGTRLTAEVPLAPEVHAGNEAMDPCRGN